MSHKLISLIILVSSLASLFASEGRSQRALFEQLYGVDQVQTQAMPAPLGVSQIEKKVEAAKINALLEGKLNEKFGSWVQVFAKDLGVAKVALGVKVFKFEGINKYWQRNDSFDIPVEWRFAVKWPWISKIQYMGATSVVWVRVQMGAEDNMAILSPELKLGIGKNWKPDPDQIPFLSKGFTRAYVNKVVNTLVSKGLSSTFKVWGNAINQLIEKRFAAAIPGNQKFELLSVHSNKDMVTARFSSLAVNLKTLLKSQIPPEEFPRLTVRNLVTAQDSITVKMDMQILETPSNIVILPGDKELTIQWDGVESATSYNLYYSTSPFMAPSTKVDGVQSPYTLPGLENGTTYYVSLTSMDAIGESGFSMTQNGTPEGADDGSVPPGDGTTSVPPADGTTQP